MRIVRRLDEFCSIIRRIKREGHSIGFVPTMGAFHEGHLSLIRRARRENDVVVVSIFVNPIQFDRASDLRSYPRALTKDSREARRAGCDLLFVPRAAAMVPPDFETSVVVEKLSRILEGRSRPGHFRGVTTVVTKLFHLVSPTVVYFGRKDAQQSRIIQQLIRDLNFDIRLRILPTVREANGLAMSSRNKLLPSRARRSSSVLFRALHRGLRLIECGERRADIVVRRIKGFIRQTPGVRIDYIAAVDPDTFRRISKVRGKVMLLGAIRVRGVRLIDNCILKRGS